MFIKSIYIGAFAGIKDKKIEFSDKMNLIEGKNESGKSTIAAFIKFIFFGLSGKGKGGDMPSRRRYIPFESNCAFGNMTVCASGRDYIIERKITLTGKTSAKDDYKISDSVTGAQVYEGKEPCDVFIGMSEALFEKTAYVSQLTGMTVAGNEVAAALENLLFSAEESVDSKKAIGLIDAARAALLHKNAKGGKIYDLECERDALVSKLAETRKLHSEYAECENQLARLREHYEENERLTAEAQKKITEYERACALAEFEKLARCRERLTATENALDAAKARFGIPTNEEIHALVRMSGTIREKETQNNTAYATLRMSHEPELPDDGSLISAENEAGIKKRISSQKKKKRSYAILSAVFILLSVICAAVRFVNVISPVICYAGAGACLIAFAAMLILSVAAGGKCKEIYKEYGITSEEELSVKAAEIRADMARYHEAEKHYASLAAIAKKSDSELEAARTEAKELCARYGEEFIGYTTLDTLASTLSKVRDECNELIQEADRLHAECKERETALSEYDESELRANPPDERALGYDIKDLKSRFTFGSASAAKQLEKISELEKKLVGANINAQSEDEISRRISAINAELSELHERHAALRLAYEKLEEASQSMKNNVSPALAERAGELIAESTDGKYRRLWIADDISIKYADDTAGGTARDTAHLSGGTRDAVYIALRIALCELLSGDKNIPMIFDESFSSIDDNRLTAVYKVLAERGGQSLVFTPHTRDRKTAADANVIEL